MKNGGISCRSGSGTGRMCFIIVLADDSGGEKTQPEAPDGKLVNPPVENRGSFRLKIAGVLSDKKVATALFLLLFISLFLLQNYLYIKADTGAQRTDYNILRLGKYYRYFFFHSDERLSEINFPPLPFLLTLPWMKILGASMESARLSFMFFSLIFLLSMYGIGYEMGGEYSGIAAMALSASSPHILNFSRMYYMDFPQTAMTALAFYVLLKTGGYKDRKFSLLLGLAVAFSFLTKWSSAFFLIIPILWFVVPHVVASLRSFLTFLAFLIPLSVSVWGVGNFFRLLKISAQSPPSGWLSTYLIFVAVPSILCFTALWFIEKRWKTDEKYLESRVYRVINFIQFSMVFALFTVPWYLWASPNIKSKFLLDLFRPSRPSFYGGLIISLKRAFHTIAPLKTLFNLAPFLLLIGIIFIILRFRKYHYLLLLPINIFLIRIFLGQVSWEDRYLLSLVIFAAALGGWWVSQTGRAKAVLTGLILIISLVSILSWTLLPGDLPMYFSIEHQGVFLYDGGADRVPIPFRFLAAEAPDRFRYDLGKMTGELSLRHTNTPRPVPEALYFYDRPPGFPFDAENIEWDFILARDFVDFKARWMSRGQGRCDTSRSPSGRAIKDSCVTLSVWFNEIAPFEPDSLSKIREILVFIRNDHSTESAVNSLKEYMPGMAFKSDEFDIGSGYRVAVLTLEKNLAGRRLPR